MVHSFSHENNLLLTCTVLVFSRRRLGNGSPPVTARFTSLIGTFEYVTFVARCRPCPDLHLPSVRQFWLQPSPHFLRPLTIRSFHLLCRKCYFRIAVAERFAACPKQGRGGSKGCGMSEGWPKYDTRLFIFRFRRVTWRPCSDVGGARIPSVRLNYSHAT